jgi:hypothetical protein
MLPMAHPSPTRVGATGLASQSVSLLGFRFPAVRYAQYAPSGILSPAIASKRRNLQCQVRTKHSCYSTIQAF